MSLSGNLATFSLDEVLLLLAQTAKSGALRVRDARTEGVVYFAAGRLCGAEVDQVSGAVEDVTALEARLVDACFALARLDDGAFEFESGRRPPWTAADEVEVGPVVERVRDLLARWPAIERHVPGLDVTPRLAETLSRETVTIDRDTWPILTAVDGRAGLRAIAATLGCSALEVAAALAPLVEAGAVTIDGAAPMVDVAPVPLHGAAQLAGEEPVEITDLEAQVSALEQAAAERDHTSALDAVEAVGGADDEVPEAQPGPEAAFGGLGAPVAPEGTGITGPFDDEPVEAHARVTDGVSMLTQDPDALALLNRAELERAALGEPIEEEPERAPASEPEPDGDEAAAGAAVEAEPVREPRPAVTRDRGALLRMFSSLRDG